MANNKQKLELTWISKNIRPELKLRILIEDPDKSYGVQPSEGLSNILVSRLLDL